MSKEIDQRIVEMRFDNEQFEKNVKTSMSTIEKLKQSLNLTGASKGLEEISSAAKNVDMSGLGSAVQTVQAKFSAFEVMAVTALANITNSAVNAGVQLVKSLSVDNISAGWEKFGQKTQSVGTLISQGYDLETVNEQLERLNWFTDETSYNFTDMVSNISKFTASGQDLKTSVTAMEGIANWAALSGQNASTASRAMYQLSQAMGAGILRLEDYKSIQNASMDTDEFRQKALDAAVSLGTLKKNADGTYSSLVAVGKAGANAFTKSQFTTHLTDGAWLTSDVMMKVFNDYSAAVNQIYEYAEEKGITASEAIEELGMSVDQFGLKAFKAAQEARTWGDVIDSVKDAVSTGWMTTFEMIFGNYEEAKTLWTDLANELYDVFAESGNARNEILAGWKELGGRDDLIESFWNVYYGIKDLVKPISEAFRDIFPSKTSEQLADFTKKLKELTSQFKISDETSEKLRNTFKGLFAILDIGKQLLTAVVKGVVTLVGHFGTLGSGVLGVTGSFGDWIAKLDESLKKGDVFNKAIQGIVKFIVSIPSTMNKVFQSITGIGIGDVFESIGKSATNFLNKIKSVFSSFGKVDTSGIDELSDKTTTAFKPITALFEGFTKVLGALWNFLKKLSPIFTALATAIGKALGSIGSAISNSLQNADFNKLFDIANGGILVAIGAGIAKFVNSLKDVTKNASGFLESITGILNGVKGCFEAWQKDIKASAIMKIAIAVGILAISLVTLSTINMESLIGSLAAMTMLFVELSTTMKAISKLDSISIKNTAAMIGMAAAILILSSALKKLSSIKFGELVTGLVGLAGIMTMLVIASKELSKNSKNMIKGSAGMIAFAIAIDLLVKPVKELGSLDLTSLAKGLLGIGVLCAELVIFLKTADLDNVSLGKGLGLMALAESISILSKAVEKFASINTGALIKGLAAVAVVLGEIVIFTKLTDNTKGLISTAVGMTILGEALIVFSKAISNLGNLSWEELAKGLIGISVALAGVVAAMKLMPEGAKMLSYGTGMILIASAMKIFSSAISSMSSMSWEELAKGLAAMGVALAEVVIAMKLMDSGALSGAAAVLVCAAALNLFIPVLKVLSSLSIGELVKSLVSLAAVFAVIGAAGYILEPVVGSILGLAASLALIGVASVAFGAGLLAISIALDAFAASAELIVVAIVKILTQLIVAIPDMVTALAKSLTAAIPALVECIVAVAKSVLLAIYEVVPMAVETVLSVIQSVLDSLASHIQGIVESLLQIIVGVLEGLASGIPSIIKSAVKLFKSIIDAIFDALGGFDISTILTATAALTALAGMMTLLTAIAIEASVSTALLPIIGNNLNKFMDSINPFLTEIQKVDPSSLKGAKYLAEMVLMLTAASILDGLTSWFTGGNSILKFGEDLAAFAPYLKQYYIGIKGIDAGVVEASANAAKALAEMATNLPNSGGLAAVFAGDNSLASFAEELTVFGPKLKAYADSVEGLDADIVINSAHAAEALSELASKLPNSGGLAAVFAGDNTLSQFAEELSEFGPKLKEYANSVDGLKPGVVEASANAAMALSELASNLPNSGGMVSWFTGDNTLSSFAEELSDFGPALKRYSDSIRGLDGELVVNSAHAAEALSELASKLPNNGGMVSWFTGDNSLSDFAEELSAFGPELKKYSDSIKGLDASLVSESATAAKALAELANGLPNSGGIASWFTGDNSLSDFAKELSKFGPELKKYADSVDGLDAEIVINSVNAAKALSEFANNIPNSGGLAAVFAGDNNLSAFAEELSAFGPKLKEYADSVSGLDGKVVVESADAAMAISNLANNLPNQGGIVSVFTGDNTLSKFAEELTKFGPSLKQYADSIKGLNTEVVADSVNAAKALAEMASNLPAVGGISQVWNGDSSLSTFAKELSKFGPEFKKYADNLIGINPDVVISSANAAKSLSEMASNLPSVGGLKAVYSGDQSLSSFAKELSKFGPELKKYADSMEGLKADVVINSTNAAKSLLELSNNLPETGGISSWWSGEQSLSDFAKELSKFGPELKKYANSVDGLKADVVIESANAAKALAEMVTNLPDQGNVTAWFTGNGSLTSFAKELSEFAPKLKEYANSIEGLKADVVLESANAALALTEVANNLPAQSGISKWIGGGQSLAVFGEELAKFGPKLRAYADSIIDIDPAIVLASANAAKALAELANNLPSSGGLANIFSGEKSLATFGTGLVSFGTDFADYASKMKGVSSDILNATTNAASSIVELQKSLPKNGGWFSDEKTLAEFGSDMAKFGKNFASYYDNIKGINVNTLNGVITETNNLISMARGMSSVDSKAMSNFSDNLKKIGKNGVDGFIGAFKDAKSRVTDAASSMVLNFIDGVNGKKSSMTKSMEQILEAVLAAVKGKYSKFKDSAKDLIQYFADGIKAKDSEIKNKCNDIISTALSVLNSKSKYNDFYNAGVYLVDGFAAGISANTFKAKAKATAMAQEALDAVKKVLKINSPSKAFYSIGNYAGIGFVNALGDYGDKSYDAGCDIANSAYSGLGNAISKIKSLIDDGIDTTPTIRPVMDLTNIQNGANQLYRMMNTVDGYAVAGSFDIASQTAKMMSRKNVASINDSTNSILSDLTKSVKELASNPSKSFENTFNITGDNPREIADEISRIIQKQIERRDASWA